MQAKGSFEVSITPEPGASEAEGVTLGVMGIVKQFHGAIEASSVGRMLAARTAEPSSAGYVAIERVTGSLEGKRGSFVLQHSGKMDRGVSSLHIEVVPDSATGELAGLRGSMTIEIVDGKHSYEFDYEL